MANIVRTVAIPLKLVLIGETASIAATRVDVSRGIDETTAVVERRSIGRFEIKPGMKPMLPVVRLVAYGDRLGFSDGPAAADDANRR